VSLLRIIDINGKEREVESVKKLMYGHPDKDGVPREDPYVEVMIIGRTRRWKEWWPYSEFKKYNPDSLV